MRVWCTVYRVSTWQAWAEAYCGGLPPSACFLLFRMFICCWTGFIIRFCCPVCCGHRWLCPTRTGVIRTKWLLGGWSCRVLRNEDRLFHKILSDVKQICYSNCFQTTSGRLWENDAYNSTNFASYRLQFFTRKLFLFFKTFTSYLILFLFYVSAYFRWLNLCTRNARPVISLINECYVAISLHSLLLFIYSLIVSTAYRRTAFWISYISQRVYVFTCVCLSVCLIVNRNTQKLLIKSSWNFIQRLDIIRGQSH